MRNVMLDQNAASALLFAVLLIVMAVRPRRGRRGEAVRGNVPAFVGMGCAKDAPGDRRGSARAELGTGARSVALRRFATPVWMMASLTLLCGVGAASALMAGASSSAYNAAVAVNSPTIFYHLDETGGGTAADSSGNSYGATYSSGVTLGASGAISGSSDTSVTAGSRGIATENSSSGLVVGAHARSLEAWFKTSSPSPQGILSYGPAGNLFELLLESGQVWLYNGAEGYVESHLFTTPADGAWHHLIGTYDGGTTGAVYLDGQQIVTGAFSAALTDSPGYPLLVGDDGFGQGFIGSIDEAAVYAAALTATQVLTHFTSGIAYTCPTVPSTGYAGTVAGDRPVRYLRLGETSGAVAADVSGDCVPGTYSSTAGHGFGAVVGDRDGAAVRTTGTDAMVTSSAAGLPVGAHPRTLEAWFKTSSSSPQGILSYGPAGNLFELLVESGQVWLYNGAGGYVESHLFTTPADGAWHHLIGTYDGGTTGAIYLDGQQIVTGMFSAALTDSSGYPLLVGDDGFGQQFTGSIDEAAVYAVALTATQVLTHFTSGVAHTCPAVPSTGYAGTVAGDGPERYFRLGETSGVVAADVSGVCVPGTYSSTAGHGLGAVVGDMDGGAVKTTGTDTMVTSSADGLPVGAHARTLEAWFKTSSSSPQGILSYGPAGNLIELLVE